MDKTATSAIPADVRQRVITAADELYEQSGRARFPTVDSVRRLSRADMNTVSGVMKDWRQSQTTQAAPVAVAVPESVQQSNSAALAALWLNATDLANQSLRSAQVAWEKEREDLDGMRVELATSYEVQAAEFETTKQHLADSEASASEQTKQLTAARQSEAVATSRAERAETRCIDLRGELDRALLETERQRAELAESRAKTDAAHAATEAVRSDLVKVQAQADAQAKQAATEATRTAERMTQVQTDRDQIRADLATAKATAAATEREALRMAERVAKAESDRDDTRNQASAAREDAAKLRGTVEALQTQVADLLRVLADRQPAPKE